MNNVVVYPILLQFLTSIVLMFLWRQIKIQKYISVTSSALSLIISLYMYHLVTSKGFMSLNAGMWEAPFGITFVVDTLSAVLVVLTSLSGLAVSAYATATISNARLRFGFLPVFHFLLTGLYGAFLTGDIFNMYVWFEIIIITSFVLLSLGGEKAQLEGAVKYFTLNILSSVFFLTALGVLYGITGTLNMADIHHKMAEVPHSGVVQLTAILFLIGFGTKAAVFPFFYWLPASYHTPPTAVMAIFGGLLTKVGVYALIRVFTLLFPLNPFLNDLLLYIAILSMIVGAMGALVQNNIVKVISYLIISHIGFMMLGLALHSATSISGALSYLIHDIIAKTNLFLMVGLLYKITGTHSLRDLGGIHKRYPKLSFLLFIPMMAAVGLPPLSGFWPKISLIQSSLVLEGSEKFWAIAGIVIASFVTLIVMAKIWLQVFWKEAPTLPRLKDFTYFDELSPEKKLEMTLPIVFLVLVTLYISFGAESISQLTTKIANEVLDYTRYVDAVFGRQ